MKSPKLYQKDVRHLYESLPFPLRNPEDEKVRLLITPADILSKINHYCFGGMQTFDSDFRALVAGGGTGDALIYLAQQLANRGGVVTYIDMSEKSMAIAQERASVRGLSNIEWVHGSLLDIPKLNLGKFDYINCMGVLHHLDNPAQGLSCLESVLTEDGAMSLMVYGRYGRLGVTVVQDMLKIILDKERDIDKKVEIATALLHALSPANAYMRSRDRATVLKTLVDDPNNLADIFLHPCDHPFTASEFQSMIEQCGLYLTVFTTYDGNPAVTRLQYNPHFMALDDVIKPHLAKLPSSKQLDIAEMMDGSLHLHTAYVSRRVNGAVANFSDSSNIPFFPTINAKYAIRALREAGEQGLVVQLSSGCLITLKPNAATLALLQAINGELSLGEILPALKKSGFVLSEINNDLSTLNALDWVLLRHQSIDAFPVVGSPEFSGDEELFATLGPKPWKLDYGQPLLQY